MNKLVKGLMSGLLCLSIAGCSAKTGSAAKNTGSEKIADAAYTSVFDVDNTEWRVNDFHGISYETPKNWYPRNFDEDDTTTFIINGAKDTLDVHFIEGESTKEAMEAFLKDMKPSKYCNMISSEDKKIGEIDGLYVYGIAEVFTTIIMDSNCDMYLIPADGGFVVVRVTLDPKGDMDYRPVYNHLIDSVKAA